jgi:L-ascorbate metabolism protein UlaG (beta-lactamase superfamily)
VQIALVAAQHSNNVPRALLSEPTRAALATDNLTAYVGHANGYVLVFSNGLRVYFSGDTAPMGDMRAIVKGLYRANLAVLNVGAFAMQSEEGAYATNDLLDPRP